MTAAWADVVVLGTTTAAGEVWITVWTVENVEVLVKRTVDSEEVVWISMEVVPAVVWVSVAVTGQIVTEVSM